MERGTVTLNHPVNAGGEVDGPMITLYTKPGCPQCTATARTLDSMGLEYRSVDLSGDPQALDLVKAMGYTQAPVVVTDTDHWSGFRPDKLATLAGGA